MLLSSEQKNSDPMITNHLIRYDKRNPKEKPATIHRKKTKKKKHRAKQNPIWRE